MSRSNLGLGRSGGQVIGVHVRHGDACEASTGYRTPCQPVEAYMKEVKVMASMYGVKEVCHVAIQQLRVVLSFSVSCLLSPSLSLSPRHLFCPPFLPGLSCFVSQFSPFFLHFSSQESNLTFRCARFSSHRMIPLLWQRLHKTKISSSASSR